MKNPGLMASGCWSKESARVEVVAEFPPEAATAMVIATAAKLGTRALVAKDCFSGIARSPLGRNALPYPPREFPVL